MPKEFIPAVEKGFKTSIEKGPLAGYPCLDFKVTLTDGGFHAVDSSAIAFEIAAKAAYRQTMPKAGPQILEPIMKVDVFMPEAHVGDVIGDLNRRRGMIKSQEPTPDRRARQGRRPAERDVRLHRRPAHHDLRSRPVLDGVQPLRGLPEQRRRRGHRQGQGARRSPAQVSGRGKPHGSRTIHALWKSLAGWEGGDLSRGIPVADPVHSVHILGSREFGGADQFFVRLVRALHDAGQPVTAVSRPASPVAIALRDDPVEQIHVSLANRWDAASWWRIRRIAAKREPCVVQTYMGRATRLTRLPAKSGAAHVARLGGFYKIDGYYRHADAWVGNTRAICDFLIKSGLPANRVHHIGNFVPEPAPADAAVADALRAEYRVPENARVLFALGRLIPKKGFQDLLHAMARLPEEIGGRETVLLLAGDGPDMEKLRALADELGVTPRVRFLGWQDPPDAFYDLADVFVCPSRHEPLGNVILEAWNHSKPVVSTRNEGAAELIEDGSTGLLCERKDDKSIAAAIQRLFEAPDAARAAMGLAGNACLNAKYGRDAIVGAYLSLYRDMLSSKAAGRQRS